MISVIIPVYNVEAYLEKCLHSILTNTYHDLEVICVNDGSPDGCLGILQRMQMEDPRIVIVDQVNQGVQMARNNGLKIATGEYIAFIDSDDFIHFQYFETLLNCMEKKNANVVICGCQKFSENDEVSIKRYNHVNYHRLSSKAFYNSYYGRRMVWGRLFRREDLEGVRFSPSVRTYDDTLFNLSVIAQLQAPSVYETDTPLYFYLQRENSIVRSSTYDKMIDYSDWYVENSNRNFEEKGLWSWVQLMQAVKLALSYRYGASLMREKHEMKHANYLLRKLMIEMLFDRNISIREKGIHVVMIVSPQVYRLFRLIQDPTMKIWEQRVREQKST